MQAQATWWIAPRDREHNTKSQNQAMALPHTSAGGSGATDFAQGAPNTTSPLSQSVHRNQPEELSGDQRGYQLVDNGADGDMRRANSTLSQSHTLTPSRGGTLKKKQSVSRKGSLKRASSRRSSTAGSVGSVAFTHDGAAEGGEMNNAFYTPVPTSGNPTEILANRFQGMSEQRFAISVAIQLTRNFLQHGEKSSRT